MFFFKIIFFHLFCKCFCFFVMFLGGSIVFMVSDNGPLDLVLGNHAGPRLAILMIFEVLESFVVLLWCF